MTNNWNTLRPEQVDEALFNLVNAWSMMFWPAMLADPRGARVKSRTALWLGTMVGVQAAWRRHRDDEACAVCMLMAGRDSCLGG